ncbi:hypothetical protein F4801DRAFT_581228 [Xylaria longipes]|nr:hypothetical protein F4801DRAFT_581228 [Xylaria longipes]RYC60257.1 hypothetical protein CHU98_g5954 [Xylaria longipes]
MPALGILLIYHDAGVTEASNASEKTAALVEARQLNTIVYQGWRTDIEREIKRLAAENGPRFYQLEELMVSSQMPTFRPNRDLPVTPPHSGAKPPDTGALRSSII